MIFYYSRDSESKALYNIIYITLSFYETNLSKEHTALAYATAL